MLGFASFAGGLWINVPERVVSRSPPRAALSGLGTIGAGQAGGNVALLYLSYGVLGGIGLGFGYIVPVGDVDQWFPGQARPDHRSCRRWVRRGARDAPVAQFLIASVGLPSTRHPRRFISSPSAVPVF